MLNPIPIRDYQKLINRLESLTARSDGIISQTLSEASGYPICHLHLSTVEQRLTNPVQSVLISAGVHVDKPAGVGAALRFLAQNDLELLDQFQFDVLLCLNPFGFIRTLPKKHRWY